MKLPVFPMWVQDYMADTYYLDATEHGVYHLLLYRYWLTECRPLTENITDLKRVAKCRYGATIQRILDEFWEHEPGVGYHSRRARLEFRAAGERSIVQRENAKKRWKIKDDTNATALPSQCPPSPSPYREKDLEVANATSRPQTPSEDMNFPPCPHQKIIELYHQHTDFRRVRTWEGERPKILQRMWRQHPDLKWWEGYLAYAAESPFLRGEVNGFQADLEWLIRPRNFQKVNEGKYHGGRRISKTDS